MSLDTAGEWVDPVGVADEPVPWGDTARIRWYVEELSALTSRVGDAKWERGALLLRAKAELGEEWAQIVDVESLPESEAVLRQEMWVAGRFQPFGKYVRHPDVSWSIHRLVCAADMIERAESLLHDAAQGNMSYRDMERLVAMWRGIDNPDHQEPLGVMTLDPDQMDKPSYVAAVVDYRCGDVPREIRKRVLAAALAAMNEWDQGDGGLATFGEGADDD